MEGLVVRFHTASGQSWVGNFQPGLTSYSKVVMHPSGQSVIVVSGGDTFQIDIETRSLLCLIAHDITEVIESSRHQVVALVGLISVYLLHADGRTVETQQVSSDGIEDVVFANNVLYGLAFDPITDMMRPFSIDIDSGLVRGGAWNIESNTNPGLISMLTSLANRPANKRFVGVLAFLCWIVLFYLCLSLADCKN